jgi:putative membrane protein
MLLGGIGALAVAVEAYAILSGFPYGFFAYSDRLGWRLFGLVPGIVFLAYPPILLGSSWLASRLTGGTPRRVVVTAFLNMAVDLAIDPAMVAMRYWEWTTPGEYYGVPWVNFAGWLLTGLIYSTLLHLGVNESNGELPDSLPDSLLVLLSLWCGILLWKQIFPPHNSRIRNYFIYHS